MLKITPALTAFRNAVSDRSLSGAEAKRLLHFKGELKSQLTRMRDGKQVTVGHKIGGRPVMGHVSVSPAAKQLLKDAFSAKH